MSFWVDVHAHLEGEEFADDRGEVIARAQEAGVGGILNAATSLTSSQETLKLIRKYPSLWGALGVHPQEIKQTLPDFSLLESWLNREKVIALGETGLDYWWDTSYQENQKRGLRIQIELAEHYRLPLVVHSRSANSDLLSIFRDEQPTVPVLWHCFSGDEADLAQALSLGFYFSVGGVVTFPKAENLRLLVKKIPQDRLLLETDSPYLSPQPKRGKRNEPAFLVYTAHFLSGWLQIEEAEFQARLLRNFQSLFPRAKISSNSDNL